MHFVAALTYLVACAAQAGLGFGYDSGFGGIGNSNAAGFSPIGSAGPVGNANPVPSNYGSSSSNLGGTGNSNAAGFSPIGSAGPVGNANLFPSHYGSSPSNLGGIGNSNDAGFSPVGSVGPVGNANLFPSNYVSFGPIGSVSPVGNTPPAVVGVVTPIRPITKLPKCGTNEEFTVCTPSSCWEDTCVFSVAFERACTSDCRSGCRCRNGFVREKGKCVSASVCVTPALPKCGANEVFTECGSSSCWEDTCAVLAQGGLQGCLPDCRQGCKCQKGFVRENGKCVPASVCSKFLPKCEVNEVFTECASSSCWEDTCTVLAQGGFLKVCTSDCSQGCKCQKGFVRENGKCVSASVCSKFFATCGVNEVFTESTSSSCWEDTCAVLAQGGFLKVCTSDIRQGCKCRKGFVRENGKCVSASVCTTWVRPKCGANEEFTECYSSSCWEDTCAALARGPRVCTSDCRLGCRCRKGFVRSNGVCRPVSICPKLVFVFPTCGEGEVMDLITKRCFAVSCASPNACPTGLMCVPKRRVCCSSNCRQYTCDAPVQSTKKQSTEKPQKSTMLNSG